MKTTNDAITVRLEVDKGNASTVIRQFGDEVSKSGKAAEKGMSGLGDEINQAMAGGRKDVRQFEAAAKQAGASAGDAMADFGNEAKEATNGAADGAERFGIALNKISLAGALGAVGGLAAAGAVFISVAGHAEDYAQAMARAKVSTGATADEMARYGEIAKDVWGQGIGDSIGEVTDAVALASKKFKGATDDSLAFATESAMGIQRLWGDDMSKVMNSAATLVEKFGLSYEEAFDFITAGYQRGLNSSDDFLDSINEYAVQFDNAGADAGFFFSILESGLQAGVLGTDKAADMFKEFSVRIVDGSKTTSDALAQLGIDADSFTGQISDGKITVAEAFTIIKDKIADVDDKVIQSQAAVGLLGTQFEDLGNKAALGVDPAKTKISELHGASDSLKEQYNTLGQEIGSAMRRLQSSMSQVLTDTKDSDAAVTNLVDGIDRLADTIDDNRDSIIGLFSAIVTVAGKAVSTVSQVVRSAELLGVVAASSDKSLWDWFTLDPEGAQQWKDEIADGTAFLKDQLHDVREEIGNLEYEIDWGSGELTESQKSALALLKQQEAQIIASIENIQAAKAAANADAGGGTGGTWTQWDLSLIEDMEKIATGNGTGGSGGSGGSGTGLGTDKLADQKAQAWQTAYNSMDTMTQATYDRMIEYARAEYEENLKLLGDKETAMALYAKDVADIAQKMYGDTPDSWLMRDQGLEAAKAQQLAEELDKYNKLMGEGITLTEAMRTPSEVLADELERLKELYDAGAISLETYNRAVQAQANTGFSDAPGASYNGDEGSDLNAQEEALNQWYANQIALLDTYRQQKSELNNIWDKKEEQLKQQHEDRLAQIELARYQMMMTSASSMFGSMASMAQNYAGEQSSTYKTLFAISKAFAIAEAMVNMWNAVSDVGSSEYGWAGKIAAMASIAASMGTIVTNISAIGMAHDGMDEIPQTGTWLLEKGERVVTESTSKRLDRVLTNVQDRLANTQTVTKPPTMSVNVYEAVGTSATVQQSDDGQSIDVIIEQVEDRVTKRMARGSGLAAYFDQRYGRRW